MSKDNNTQNFNGQQTPGPDDESRNDINIEDADAEVFDVEPDDDNAGEVPAGELENLRNLLKTKEEEVAKEKKEYMFLMAEFENFRKRTIRERADLIKTAAEKALQGLLPVVDDFERGLEAAKGNSDADAIMEGMQLIYNKLIKYLADNGVKPMATDGQDFDPEFHDAVAMVPADDETPSGKIKDTVQKGYTINDKVMRHAKVVVAQ